MPYKPQDNLDLEESFLVRGEIQVITAGIDRTTDPDKSCNYCKDMGHKKDNCLCLQKHNAFLASQGRSRERLN